jgi:hypothetical protein
MARKSSSKSRVASKADYAHICPICRIYDPSHFVHHPGCPCAVIFPIAMHMIGINAARMRRDGVNIRGYVRTPKISVPG